MKSLYDFIIRECGNVATPMNTIGMGDPSINGEILSEPIGHVSKKSRDKLKRRRNA